MDYEMKCAVLEYQYYLDYLKRHPECSGEFLDNGFPMGWYDRTDYEVKLGYLAKAIKLNLDLEQVLLEEECKKM